MNAEMMNRVMEAGKYQKKAIMALFPDSFAGHIEVIEKELSAMFMEYAVEMAGKCMQQKEFFGQEDSSGLNEEASKEASQNASKQAVNHKSKVRKVSIDL